jgi:hypothetical protein
MTIAVAWVRTINGLVARRRSSKFISIWTRLLWEFIGPTRATESFILQGRPCLGYERIDRFVLDPDTLRSSQTLPRRSAVQQTDSEPVQGLQP